MPKGRSHNADLMRAVGEKYIYEPHGAALELFHTREEEVLLAGPAGTGKSLAALHKVHAVMSKYPAAKGLMSRKTRTSMTNACLDMFQRHVLKPPDKVHFHKQDQQFRYPNGSLISVIGLDESKRVMSTEFDIAYIQEVTECTEEDWENVSSRMRSHIVPYQQQIGDCNPDKPTHWMKKRCDTGKTKMLHSFHEDNPVYYNQKSKRWTPQGEKYRRKLDRLSGARRARLYLGEWVAAEGMVYEKWDPAIHMISRVDMPHGWEKWPHYWSIDWGFAHPMVIQDWIEDPQTLALYLNWEIYQTGWLVEDMAKYVMKKVDEKYIPRAIICDHDLEDRKVFERYTNLLTLPAYKHIQPGVQAVQARLDPNWRGKGRPGIFLIRDSLDHIDTSLKEAGLPYCTEQEIDGYTWDKKHNLEVNSKKDELPVDVNNHGCDAKRYMVAFADDLAEDPEDVDGIVELAEPIIISRY